MGLLQKITSTILTKFCTKLTYTRRHLLIEDYQCTKSHTVCPKKYAHGFCFAVLCCGYTLTDFPISIRLTSLALWQSNDCPSASNATLMNMDKYFMWIHYERLHNHNKAKHNKTVCIFLGIYCMGYPFYDRELWPRIQEFLQPKQCYYQGDQTISSSGGYQHIVGQQHHMASYILINIGSGTGLLLDGTESSRATKLAKHQNGNSSPYKFCVIDQAPGNNLFLTIHGWQKHAYTQCNNVAKNKKYACP